LRSPRKQLAAQLSFQVLCRRWRCWFDMLTVNLGRPRSMPNSRHHLTASLALHLVDDPEEFIDVATGIEGRRATRVPR